LVAVTKSLVMLVNKSVLATQVLVQNGRANYFVPKLRAATIGTYSDFATSHMACFILDPFMVESAYPQ
jgi:hypothetical protein